MDVEEEINNLKRQVKALQARAAFASFIQWILAIGVLAAGIALIQ